MAQGDTYDPDLPDGLYLGMEEEEYFAQNRLGSTDLVKLCDPIPENWWYSSKQNPDREEPERDDERLFGSALHKYTLEGVDAFTGKFERSPFKSYGEAGAKLWKAQVKARKHLPLSGANWRNVFQMGELIANHPQLSALFRAGLSEVTVLFTYEGIPMRARFDKMMASRSLDLKSWGAHKQLPSDEDTCVDIIVKMKYAVQRYIYDVARQEMRRMIDGGLIFGADADERRWLEGVAKVDQWEWMWVFFRKVSHNSKNPYAPVVTPIVRPPQDATYVRGQAQCDLAVSNYKRLVAQWGLNRPWARINAVMVPDDQKFIDLYNQPRHRDAPAAVEEDEEEETEDDGV